VIYAHRFTREEEGYVSLAGPLTNFAVFVVFFFLSFFSTNAGKFVQDMLGTTMLVSLILAFFNMLPIYPLDGSKVLRWNKVIYSAVIVLIFVLLIVVTQWEILYELVFMLIIAFVISSLYRRVPF
jgi:Zn-dependent protease